jgi:pyridoxal phosphate enzyme (YggS family)
MELTNLKEILSEIQGGNCFNEKVYLVGATKMVDYQTINLAIEQGLKIIAENKVQEYREKHPFIKGAEEHFIGHLQTNKVKYLVGGVSLIQSVDSLHLAQEIGKCATKKGIVQDILVEVNVGGELSKSGFSLDNALESVKNVALIDGVCIKGLMAMLPKSQDEDYLAGLVRKMRKLYNDLICQGFDFKYLSVGMSADYRVALDNGSNMIRIGSGIFGKRNYEVK